jgi:hypothetical protein
MRWRLAADQRNCAAFAIDIDGRIRRHAFLQVGNFRHMARSACASSQRPGPTLCQAVRTEVVRMAELATPFGTIRLMRKSRPPIAKPTRQYRQLRIRPRFHRVALLVAPDPGSKGVRADFHFIREVGRSNWLHKPGRHRVTDKDSDGRVIRSPEAAARAGRLRSGKGGPTYRFCAYMWVVARTTRVEIARRLALRSTDAIVTALDRSRRRR